jgi:hypothetical protein
LLLLQTLADFKRREQEDVQALEQEWKRAREKKGLPMEVEGVYEGEAAKGSKETWGPAFRSLGVRARIVRYEALSALRTGQGDRRERVVAEMATAVHRSGGELHKLTKR